MTQICPVPLPLWMADSAGKGILIVAVCHGLAQLEARWNDSGARAIWDTAGIKVILGGVSDADTLDQLSQLCGEIEQRTHGRTIGHDGRRARTITYQPVRVLPPDLLRTLPEWRALVLCKNLSPVVVRLRMAWHRHDYRRARRTSGRSRHPAAVTADSRTHPPGSPVDMADVLVPPVPHDGGWRPDELEPQPTSADELAGGHNGGGWPRPTPTGIPPHDTPTVLPPEFGQKPPPHPRRPWEPPADPRNRR